MNSNENAIRELKENEIIIYGAGIMGQSLCQVLREAPYNKNIICFVVKSKIGNPDSISGVKVLSIEEAYEYKHKQILVALHEKYIKGAISGLKAAGFDKLTAVTFDNDLWSDIRELWLNHNTLMPYAVLPSLSNKQRPNIHIYVVHSEFDQVLKEDIQDTSYEISIQAGAELAEHIYYEISDNMGDNISNKNRQYCELTALYWVWKHDVADYIGLCHYRRKFQLDGMDVATILSGHIDMAVTVPVLNLNTVKGQYIKDHCEEDWNIMTEAVKKLSPQYGEAVEKVGSGLFYYAYNMFIAKKEVMDDYCTWLFPILSYCEEKIGEKRDAYQNRYIGFLGERLLTVYIAHHPELRVAIAKKHFIENRFN